MPKKSGMMALLSSGVRVGLEADQILQLYTF